MESFGAKVKFLPGSQEVSPVCEVSQPEFSLQTWLANQLAVLILDTKLKMAATGGKKLLSETEKQVKQGITASGTSEMFANDSKNVLVYVELVVVTCTGLIQLQYTCLVIWHAMFTK